MVFGYVACKSSQIPVIASSGKLLHCPVLGGQMTIRLSPHLPVCGDPFVEVSRHFSLLWFMGNLVEVCMTA